MNGARTIGPTDQKRKRLAEYDHRTDESRQERERYAAEGPQLSVADRKFVGIVRRPFIDGFVNQHALGLLNLRCDYCNATHSSCSGGYRGGAGDHAPPP